MVYISSLGRSAVIVPDGTYDGMTFLNNLVCGDQGLERLNLIG